MNQFRIFYRACLVFAALLGAAHAQTGDKPVLMYFDVFLETESATLQSARKPLSKALGSGVAQISQLRVLDQSTRNTLMKQRSINLADCDKEECRLSIARAMPGVNLALESTVQQIKDQCTVSLEVKDVKTSSIKSSKLQKTACELGAVRDTIYDLATTIWPPRQAEQSEEDRIIESQSIGKSKGRKNTQRQKRMVFFDVIVDSKLANVKKAAPVLTKALSVEIAQIPHFQILDRSTRNQMILERKMKIEDCDKAECRFAIAKSLPGMDYSLEASIVPFGESCAMTMEIKSLRTGAIESSNFFESVCDSGALLDVIQRAAADIWPPKKTNKQARLLVLSKPKGASITIDGRKMGETPWKGALLPGEYELSLLADGYHPFSKGLDLKAGTTYREDLSLRKDRDIKWPWLITGLVVVPVTAIIDATVLQGGDRKTFNEWEDWVPIGFYAFGGFSILFSFAF